MEVIVFFFTKNDVPVRQPCPFRVSVMQELNLRLCIFNSGRCAANEPLLIILLVLQTVEYIYINRSPMF
jgi:hypothetical protein